MNGIGHCRHCSNLDYAIVECPDILSLHSRYCTHYDSWGVVPSPRPYPVTSIAMKLGPTCPTLTICTSLMTIVPERIMGCNVVPYDMWLHLHAHKCPIKQYTSIVWFLRKQTYYHIYLILVFFILHILPKMYLHVWCTDCTLQRAIQRVEGSFIRCCPRQAMREETAANSNDMFQPLGMKRKPLADQPEGIVDSRVQQLQWGDSQLWWRRQIVQWRQANSSFKIWRTWSSVTWMQKRLEQLRHNIKSWI